eukprot:scaffold19441_cov129-Isochrysis_galbana.AAC.2
MADCRAPASAGQGGRVKESQFAVSHWPAVSSSGTWHKYSAREAERVWGYSQEEPRGAMAMKAQQAGACAHAHTLSITHTHSPKDSGLVAATYVLLLASDACEWRSQDSGARGSDGGRRRERRAHKQIAD